MKNLCACLVILFIVFATVFAANSTTEPTPTCLSDSDCNGHGKCVNSVCKCETGYITHKGVNCNYKQKEKLVAFLLSFLIGATGADWFYLSSGSTMYIVIGVIKLLTGFVGIGLPCCLGCAGCLRSDGSKIAAFVIIIILITLLSLTNAVWWLADWIRVLVDNFKDGNGIDLKNW